MGRAKSSSWSELVRLSEACAEQVAVAFRRLSWRRQDDTERRIAEAHQLVQMGEIAFVSTSPGRGGSGPGNEGHVGHSAGSRQEAQFASEPVPDIPANVGVSGLDETLDKNPWHGNWGPQSKQQRRSICTFSRREPVVSVSFILFRWNAKQIQSSPSLPLMGSVRSTSYQDGPC